MTTLLILVALFGLSSLMHTLAMLPTGLCFGATVEECALFVGPRLCRFRIAGVLFKIRWLPIGGYVKFYDPTNESDTTAPDPGATPPRSFSSLHPVVRAAIILSGCTTLLLVAALCLGPAEAWPVFLRGFVQFPTAAVAPFSTGKELVARLADVAALLPFGTALGLFCAKVAALNLFPLPALNGGAFLLTLFRWKRPAPFRFETIVGMVGVLVLLLFGGSVLLAVLAYCYSLLV
jgi:membrane-associated protease RseP (regulator of RpoE activity)